ncbi:pullulanase [Anaerobacillus sp. CMMVII]|uniref:DUF6509 family protein n=1 Tax=Anaerobacillus sp. CMMVII TaxID=2755588 RepID=UPI0021B78C65|nr:DUF6509 family protein [Anaerobacillus sp. CMMVII]MCT8138454.1 pullulanase [Anaerobacillus sp. CMMVII]
MNIIKHTVEKVEDITGILSGERYEFFIHVEVDEEDELYTEHGLYIKAIVAVDENTTRMMHYDIYEKTSDKYIDLALEEEEEQLLQEYCQQHIK